MHFQLVLSHRQKKLRDFMQRKDLIALFSSSYMSYKTYGMFITNTQYVNYRHQRRFKTAHTNVFLVFFFVFFFFVFLLFFFPKYNVRSYNCM